LAGCNAVLGIGDASLDPEEDLGSAGATGLGAAGSSGGAVPVSGEACSEEGVLVCGRPPNQAHDRAVLSCQGGTFEQVFECPGLQDCFDGSSQSSVACGTGELSLAYALAEAPCGAEGAAACDFDAEVLLECEAGSWVESRHCSPSRCVLKTVDGQKGLSCENGGYSEGDRCGFTAGNVVCSTDLSAILICDGGTAVVKERCSGSKQCTALAGGSLGCG
jgi:hypothetical protein